MCLVTGKGAVGMAPPKIELRQLNATSCISYVEVKLLEILAQKILVWLYAKLQFSVSYYARRMTWYRTNQSFKHNLTHF